MLSFIPLTPPHPTPIAKTSALGGGMLASPLKEPPQGESAFSKMPRARVSTHGGMSVRRTKSAPALHVLPEKRDEVQAPGTTGAPIPDWDILSKEQRDALHRYTLYGHALNGKLRSRKPLTDTERKLIQDIDSAIETLSRGQNKSSRTLTLRGVPPSEGKPRFAFRPGDVVKDPAYLSSTTSVDVALEKAWNGIPRQWNGNLLLLSTSGGADLRNVAAHDMRREAEVLGVRNKSMRCSMAYEHTDRQVPLNVAYFREIKEDLHVEEEQPRPPRKTLSLHDIARLAGQDGASSLS